MKHINSINEFFYRGEKIDKDYIRSVFSEFIDNDAIIELTDDPRDDDYVCEVTIPIPKLGDVRDIDKIIDHSQICTDIFLNIKSCINRVKDEFPHIDSKIFPKMKSFKDSFNAGKYDGFVILIRFLV